ncbi:MAG: DUF484 family protein [Methylococcaceae bacterium]
MNEKIETTEKKPRKPRVLKPKEIKEPVEKVVKPKIVKTKPEKTLEINATQVADYLKSHSDFFIEHVHLLEHLTIPHPSGVAVSLISKQLELFRSRSQEMENQLIELIEIARGNDAVVTRMHKLNLALLDATTLEEVVTNLNIVLSEYFLTDFVAIRLIQDLPNSDLNGLFVASDSNELKPFAEELRTGKPSCGKPTLTQARMLFGFQANEVKSCAIVPLLFTELEGLLAIGSRDESRFHASMGHLFLTQMSEVIATRLITLLQSAK